MDERTARLGDALETHCRLATRPVAVKLAREGEVPPGKFRRPRRDLGHPLAVCQGLTLARTLGWALAFDRDDHACPLPRVFLGHIPPERFLEGVAADFYQDEPEAKRAMEASYPRWPGGAVQEVWLAPIDRCGFVPDAVVAYGNPAQILTLIQGANYGHGPGIRSTSSGRYGCSAWLAGVVQSGECTYLVPGPGERVFAGTQDHEMSFAVPYPRFDRLIEGLGYVRSRGAYRYPVPNLAVLAEPRIPESYRGVEEAP